jgi:hypothetical protein
LRELLTRPTEAEDAGETFSNKAVEARPEGRLLSRLRMVAALLITLAAVHLHWIFLTHAGGLWRDEVAITNIATLPSWGEVWRALPHDHCPMLFAAILRGWSAAFGGSDGALRALAFLIGLLLLGSIWAAGRMIWRGIPIVSLALFGLNVMVIRFGDSIRAYGVATALIVLTMALIWCFVEKPTLLCGVGAAALAIASVQTLYQNAVLVGALCLAACAVFLRQRQWRRGVAALAIGLPAAVSLAPYVRPLLQAQSWWVVSKAGITERILWGNISFLAGHPLRWFRFVWVGLLAAAVLLAAERVIQNAAGSEDSTRNRALFAGLALVLGVLGFGFFVSMAQLPTEAWYFLVPMGFAAVCCDAILADSSVAMRWAVVGLAVIAGVLAYPSSIAAMKFRQTDADIVARQLAGEAAPNDLVVVNPWYCGVSFDRYYHGPAPWTTLAGLSDYRYHRYDLLKQKLAMAHPTRAEMDRVAATLQAGHRVWVVGWIPAVPVAGGPPPDLPPAPSGPSGWFDEPYNQAWGAQLDYLVETRALVASSVPVASKAPISGFENMRLYVFAGWRAPAEAAEPHSK